MYSSKRAASLEYEADGLIPDGCLLASVPAASESRRPTRRKVEAWRSLPYLGAWRWDGASGETGYLIGKRRRETVPVLADGRGGRRATWEEGLALPGSYYLDESDPDILLLRRQDGTFVAAFSAQGATREGIFEAAEEDHETLLARLAAKERKRGSGDDEGP